MDRTKESKYIRSSSTSNAIGSCDAKEKESKREWRKERTIKERSRTRLGIVLLKIVASRK